MQRLVRNPLYLDTARIGLMRCGARQACEDMAAIASIDPHTVYHEFVCPSGPSLIRHWHGMDALKKKVLDRVQFSAHTELEAASNSATLLKLAGRCLFSKANNPLTTDLIWPNHLNRLQTEAKLANKKLQVVPLREQIVNGAAVGEILAQIVEAYSRNHCDALFLTAISSDGIRLPIEDIVNKLRGIHLPKLTIVDGAQEFTHLNQKSDKPVCDMYLFGSHKWLGAYYPVSLMSFGLARSKEYILRTRDRMIANCDLSDPLLANVFCSNGSDRYETVDLKPFFAVSGAIHSLLDADLDDDVLQSNARLFLTVAQKNRWRIASVAPEFRTGICLIQQDSKNCLAPRKMEYE
ncbi:MAG: aminotransferase class V-fold PLP-dependent enzyme, partial [Planctomycetota bacterium]